MSIRNGKAESNFGSTSQKKMVAKGSSIVALAATKLVSCYAKGFGLHKHGSMGSSFPILPHLRPQYDIFVGLDTINWPTKFNKIILQKNGNQFKLNHLISNLVILSPLNLSLPRQSNWNGFCCHVPWLMWKRAWAHTCVDIYTWLLLYPWLKAYSMNMMQPG